MSPKLVVIVGETASGKSALALELAQRFKGEIIAADSWTVRKGLDIGTAKPSLLDQAIVKHHLLDIVEPCEPFSAAVFQKLANQAIGDIVNGHKLPIMVGGTGLYIDSVLYNFSFLDEGDSKEREYLNTLSIKQLLQIIEERNLNLTGIDIRNKRRLIRLIETNGSLPTKSELRPNTLIIGLKISRAGLRKNIEQRVDKMFRLGLKHEVNRLVENYGWDCEALKGIGYQEWQDYFSKKASLAKTKQRIIKSTLELAKRQRTWFKRNRHILWVDNRDEAAELVKNFLG